MSYIFTSELQQTLDIQVHRLATNLIFDEHGMSPYYGLVSAFEPDHDETLDNIEALDSEFLVDGSSFWQGQLADPEGNVDDGLCEYQYQVWEDDGVEDRGVNLQLRHGYPDPVHVETGDPGWMTAPPSFTARKPPKPLSSTLHSAGHPDSHQLKQATYLTDSATGHSESWPRMTRFTQLTGPTPLSTPTVGRLFGTANCLSV